MDENVRVPVSEFNALTKQAAEVPALEERERILRGLMSKRDPERPQRRRPKRQLTPQQKAERAKRKAVRNAQREARKMNRKPKGRRR